MRVKLRFGLDVVSIVVAVVVFVLGGLLSWALTRSTNEEAQQLANDATQQSRQLEWRLALKAEGAFPGADLHNLDLTGLYIAYSDLGASNDVATNFSDGTLTGVRFDGADLRGADFSRARLDGASFGGADLAGAVFSNTSLADTSFRGADLRGVVFKDAGFWNTDLSGANLRGAKLSRNFTIGVCWNKFTKWPNGYHPKPPFCDATPTTPASNSAPPITVQYRIDTSDAIVGEPLGSPVLLTSAGEKFTELLRFENEGAVTLNGIDLLTALNQSAQYLKPISAALVNGNYPKGYPYSGDSIQANGSQVNVNIGDYGSGPSGVAYLKIKYMVKALPSSSTCSSTPLILTSYASPQGYGAMVATLSVEIHSSACAS
jgi:uncharacterized protein YjbI with pentapeptide repeats